MNISEMVPTTEYSKARYKLREYGATANSSKSNTIRPFDEGRHQSMEAFMRPTYIRYLPGSIAVQTTRGNIRTAAYEVTNRY